MSILFIIPPENKVWGWVYCFQVVCDSDFVSAQYLENELTEFYQILHMH